jgi:drug/metabolite transporter (DMT)-like permease
VVKDVLAHVDPVVLVGYRFTLAAGLLGAWLLLRRAPLLQHWRQGLWLGFILWILYVAQTIGLGITTASNSGFITGLFIVFVPLVNWLLFRRRTGWLQLAAVALALAGLWLLTGGVNGINAGDLMTLAAAVTYALHVIIAGRYMEQRIDPWVLNFQQILVIGLLGLLTALAQWGFDVLSSGQAAAAGFGAHFAVAGTGAWWTIVFLAVFPTITAYIAQLYGQQLVSATRAALLFTLEPVFAAAFAWTLGGELFRPVSALGGGLMVAAMVLSELPALAGGRAAGNRRNGAGDGAGRRG